MKLGKEDKAALLNAVKQLEQALETCEMLRDDYQTRHAELSDKVRESEKGEALEGIGEAFERAADSLQQSIDDLSEYQQ